MKRILFFIFAVLSCLFSASAFSQQWNFSDITLPAEEKEILDMANSLFEMGELEKSLETLNQFNERLDSVYIQSFMEFVKSKTEDSPAVKESEYLFEKEKYEESLRVASEFLKNNPRDYRAIVAREQALSETDSALAIEECGRILYFFPFNSEILGIRGRAYYNLQLIENAIKDFSAAVMVLKNKDANIYILRGLAYFALAQYDNALLDFGESIKINPKGSNQAYIERSSLYYAMGEIEKAEADCEIYMNGGGKKSLALRNLIAINIRNGEYKKALDYSNNLVKLSPTSSVAYTARANSYFYMKKYKKSLKDSNKAIELNPKYSSAYCIRCLAYIEEGGFEKALLDVDKAVECSESRIEYQEAYKTRGIFYLATKKIENALINFNKALELSGEGFERQEIELYISTAKNMR